MIEFDINERSELTVKAEVLTVSAFNEIWRSDKAPNKVNALKLLRYVFFMADMREKNPHRDIAYHLRESYAKSDVFGDPDYQFPKKEQEMVNNAISWYTELNRDCIDRLAVAMNKQVDQIVRMMEENESITLQNYKERVDFLKDIKGILISKQQTDEFVEKARKKIKTKGNTARSPLEQGLIKAVHGKQIEQASPSE